MSKEIISIGSETRPPVLVVGEYQQWKRRMINFLDLLDDKLMVSITEGPIRPTVTVAEVARTDVTPYLPAYEVEKPYDMFSHEQRARAAIDKCALTLLTMALPNDMFARVDSCKDARAMWLGIEQQMQGGDKALEGQKENAMNAYESFCAREGETLTETYNRLNICVNDLRRLGLEKNKYEVNVKFLKRLNKLWQSVTISIQVSQNLGQLGLHDLYSMMLPHEETLFGKTEKKIDPPTLALLSNRGSSSHENYTVEEPVVLDDGLTEEEMFQLENSFALMAKFRGNPQRFNRFRQGPQFVGGQSSQGGYQSRESFQRNDQGRTNNYQHRDGSGYNNQGSYQDRRQGYNNNNQQQQMDQDYNYNENRGYQGGSYNQRWNDQSGSNYNNQNQKTNDDGRQHNNTGGTEPPQQNKLPALEAPPAANQNRNPARVPTCYNCGDPGHYASDCKKKLKDSAYFEKKAAVMKKKEQGKVLLADEEDWIMEPEDSDDEGPSAVQGLCLMADFEEPCISGSPNDSIDEEAEVHSCSLLSKPNDLSKSETLRLESQLQMERALVARFRIESAVYKSSLEDLTENFNRMELESGIRESILETKLLDLQKSHDEIESSREELKLKFHILSLERTKLSDCRSTNPKLVLDPNVVYDVKVFLDADDPPSGYIPRKPVLPKAPAVKQISSPEPLASVSVINTEGRTCAGTDKGKSVKLHTPTVTQTENSKSTDTSCFVKPIKGLDFHSSSFDVGENSKPKQPLKMLKSVCQNTANFKGGQSILVKPSPNSQLAFHADARTGDGTANVKPRRRRYRKKKNSFNAFPKWGGHDHTGLGYNPPSCNSNMKSKSVHFNRSANSDNLTAFKNHICSLFDNYMRVDMPGNANTYSNSGSPHRERKEKMTKQSALPPVKSSKPKEKSEKDTSPVALSVSNGRTPMWQWVPKQI
ncbi:hypothetical protein OSB04_007022 [Centaurea solstitialis]|uniref:CCHC-type domain-containing protein n=1 Tax=Centaurea solstitialis TaxID=347529 RepID=A0AA38WI30_9ASTR|nr:hypothetical protein OSB04_007022 [Centaurea solstitialis]